MHVTTQINLSLIEIAASFAMDNYYGLGPRDRSIVDLLKDMGYVTVARDGLISMSKKVNK